MESLIYDRTLSDITNLTSKGKFNASFLNRVESWTKYLNDKFNELGYQTNAIKSTVSGTLPLRMPDSANKPIDNYRIYGNNGGVGDLVSDGDYTGKYKIPIKISGKNVCKESEFDGMYSNGGYNNYDGVNHIITFTSDVTGWSYGRYKFISNLTPKTKYTVSFYIRGTEGKKVACGWDGRRTNITLTSEYKRYSATTTASGTSLGIVFYTWAYSSGGLGAGEYMQFKDVQVEVGNTMTDFTPYTDESNEYSIYLNEPLQANEYIDSRTQDIYIPPLTTIKGGSTMYVNTTVSPSKAEVTYTMNKDGYKEKPITVDYIESTGTQYIDTNKSLSATTTIEVDFQIIEKPTGNSCGIVGGWGDPYGMIIGIYNTNYFKFAYGGPWNGSSLQLDFNRHKAYINKNSQCLIDGTVLADSSTPTGTISSNRNVYIFQSSGGANNPLKMKLFSYKRFDDGILTQYLIPAIDPNGIVCLYDKVSNTYFYNQGTGEFKARFRGGYINYLNYDYASDFSNVIYRTYHFAEIKNLKPNTDYTIDNINEDYFKELQNKYTLGDFTICLTKSLTFSNVYTYLRMNGTNISSKKNFTTNDTGTAYLAIYVGGTMSGLSNEEKWNEAIKLFENARIYETNLERWQTKDDFTIDEADRIINNINVLRSIIALYNDTPATPETMRFLDYIKANNIEKILFDIDKLVNNMVANFRYAGTFYSGEVGLC